ncbi:MAG: DinB family protein [Terriglobales bacterium]
MTQVANWFERKFEFTFPVELYPNLIVRLWGTPLRLEELVRGRPRELMTRRPQLDKWSAQEHAGHLLDLEPLWMGRVEDYLSGRYPANQGELTAADLSNRKTHEANHNARPVQEILGDFQLTRQRLLDRVGNFEPETFARSMVHPRLKKPMRLVDHLYFVAEHDDHHLAKIWELIER